MSVKRVYVERKDGYDFEARSREEDFRRHLDMPVEKVRVLHRYDVEGLTDEQFRQAAEQILGDGATENLYFEDIPDLKETDGVIASEYKPGQFNQRTHSAEQIMAFMTRGERPTVRYAKVFVVEGGDVDKIKEYLINREDAREATLDKYETLRQPVDPPKPVEIVKGFTEMSDEELRRYVEENRFAMSFADAKLVQEYFEDEGREPTITELRVIDAYWSDHARHTTFRTVLDKVTFGDGRMDRRAEDVFEEYLRERREVDDSEEISLMDLATMYLREAKYSQRLRKLDESGESDNCAIRVTVTTDQGDQRYIVMFKNETRNSPTEADPLGGEIGRAHV